MERFIFNQLIVDSGKDVQGRPIISVFCCHFPDPDATDYDELLELSFKRLNRIVANEYIVVVFTEPLEDGPSLSWMYKAYQSLQRDYKKNIKKLIIVHPNWFFRLIISFMQNVVSSKFAKKIVNVTSIDELEDIISTEEMMIPAIVREYDREENGERFEEEEIQHAQAVLQEGIQRPIFKLSLAMACPDLDYPDEIRALMEHLKDKCLKSDSIFRKSPNIEKLEEIKSLMDNHLPISFDSYDCYTLASTLKEYVRLLPDPIFPETTYDQLAEVKTIEDANLPSFIAKFFIRPLDNQRKILLKDVCLLSAMTAQLGSYNKMSAKALAVVWAPNMIRMESRSEEAKALMSVIKILECMIGSYDEVFCKDDMIW